MKCVGSVSEGIVAPDYFLDPVDLRHGEGVKRVAGHGGGVAAARGVSGFLEETGYLGLDAVLGGAEGGVSCAVK